MSLSDRFRTLRAERTRAKRIRAERIRAEKMLAEKSRAGADDRVERDGGFTLPEMLVAMTVSGVLVASLAMAFSVVVQSQSGAQQRISESKDITFVQTWLPADLSSATQTWLEPQLGFPFVADLPGVNVLTMSRPDLDADTEYLIMYRYEDLGNQGWALVRYRIDNPGCPTSNPVVGNCSNGNEAVKRIGVAYELVAPPADWDETSSPTFAIEVTRRNGGGSGYGSGTESRPVGEDVRINFVSGSIYLAGGSGLSAGQSIDPNPQVIPDPVAPPSRCGRRILLVVDMSGSIGDYADLREQTIDAAESFVTGFQGTPGELSVVGFDEWIEPLSGPIGDYYDTLNDADGKMAYLLTTVLPGMDGVSGSTPFAFRPHAGGTNWEVAIQASYALPTDWEEINGYGSGDDLTKDRSDLEYLDYIPDLVVFITDGDPTFRLDELGNYHRDDDGGDTNAARTAAAANRARQFGVTDLIGVYVNNSSSSASIARLATVVGGTAWNNNFPGNADVADYFAGSFDQLGGIVQSITARECGGALTLQKRFSDGTAAATTGVWDFQSEQGSKILDYGNDSSVTFQHQFQTGETNKEFWVEEQPRDGWVVGDATCEEGGEAFTAAEAASRISRVDPGNGDPVRFTFTLLPDQALSCIIESTPES